MAAILFYDRCNRCKSIKHSRGIWEGYITDYLILNVLNSIKWKVIVAYLPYKSKEFSFSYKKLNKSQKTFIFLLSVLTEKTQVVTRFYINEIFVIHWWGCGGKTWNFIILWILLLTFQSFVCRIVERTNDILQLINIEKVLTCLVVVKSWALKRWWKV